MGVHESGEMYLEAIHVLTKNKGHVRSIDVSEYLGYSKPSVSRAMGILRNGGYITVDKDDGIVLTEAGLKIAEKIYARHTLLTKLLVHIGVSEEKAAEKPAPLMASAARLHCSSPSGVNGASLQPCSFP